jgi:NhaA family Na+:H+ antiporter
MTYRRLYREPLARRETLPEVFRSEAAGGALLIAAAAAAFVWSNVAPSSYDALLGLRLGVGAFAAPLDRGVNDGMMVVFFLLVGLEIRREMHDGELATLPRLAAPAFAALGGMIAPAAIMIAFNWHHPAALRGWAVPVATDIAFSLAVLRVLGRRVPLGLKVFLTALAVIDDIGAIGVIAVFYTDHLAPDEAAGAVLIWLALFGLNRAGVRALWVYLGGGLALWSFVAASGVHPTIAGVALAFVVPMKPREGEDKSPAHRLEDELAGVVSVVVLPLFGLANAGLRLGTLPGGVFADPLVLGIALGLFFGKQIGVFGATRLASAAGLGRLPTGLTWGQIYGASVLCGVGFTMSLFIADLAFSTGPRHDEAKLAVFLGSIAAAVLALVVLWRTTPRPAATVE